MVKRCIIFACILVYGLPAFAQKKPTAAELKKGETLYISCIHCHGTTSAALADPLQRIRKVRTAGYLYKLMQNPTQFAEENKTAKKVFEKRGLPMPAFDQLSKTDIKAIFDYLDSLPYDPKNYTYRKRRNKHN